MEKRKQDRTVGGMAMLVREGGGEKEKERQIERE